MVVAEIAAAEGRGEAPPPALVAERAALVETQAATLAGLSRAELQQKRASLQALAARLRGPQAGPLAAVKLPLVLFELEAAEARPLPAGGRGK